MSSEQSIPPKEMSRDQLEQRVTQLEGDHDALEARINAMSKRFASVQEVMMGDRLTVEDTVEQAPDLWTRLDQVEETVDQHNDDLGMLDDLQSDKMSTEARVLKIRRYLVQTAEKKGVNVYGIDYRRVHSLFDGEISESWASQLMEKVGGTFFMEGDKPKEGFYLKKKKKGNQEIRVNLEQIEDRSLLAVKNSEREEAV